MSSRYILYGTIFAVVVLGILVAVYWKQIQTWFSKKDTSTPNSTPPSTPPQVLSPVDCKVSEWSDWGACSKECGGGTQSRTRTVTTPAANGGTPCPTLSDTQPCNTQDCPTMVLTTKNTGDLSCDAYCQMDPNNEIPKAYGWSGVKCTGVSFLDPNLEKTYPNITCSDSLYPGPVKCECSKGTSPFGTGNNPKTVEVYIRVDNVANVYVGTDVADMSNNTLMLNVPGWNPIQYAKFNVYPGQKVFLELIDLGGIAFAAFDIYVDSQRQIVSTDQPTTDYVVQSVEFIEVSPDLKVVGPAKPSSTPLTGNIPTGLSEVGQVYPLWNNETVDVGSCLIPLQIPTKDLTYDPKSGAMKGTVPLTCPIFSSSPSSSSSSPPALSPSSAPIAKPKMVWSSFVFAGGAWYSKFANNFTIPSGHGLGSKIMIRIDF